MLLPIPFTDLTSRKVHPAIVLGQSTHPGDLSVAPISSQLQNVAIPLRDWRAAGLNAPCGIKSQIATIQDRLVPKSVGTLAPADQAALDAQLRTWLAL